MGSGIYSCDTRTIRASSLGFYTKSADQIFTARTISNALSPAGVTVRESRDSAEHPASVAIILALDVTGSMGRIPQDLIKDGLPKIMGGIIQRGIKDPQLMFMGIGDHECDRAPLQVGQFESSDELIDECLTNIYLEGGGGGNAGESYLLAWYFAGHHTAIDCWEKRKQKGFLFTIGDEPCLPELPAKDIKALMACSQASDMTSHELLAKAKETYNVYHINIEEGARGRDRHVIDGWKQLLGDNLIRVKSHRDVATTIADVVIKTLGADTVTADSTDARPAVDTSSADTDML